MKPRLSEIRAEVRRRAAAFRAQQKEVVDTAALIREAREELDRRGEPVRARQSLSACGGRRALASGRTTAGFQENPLA